ncbi:MAG: metallophosphoesterase [Acidobacteriota bacterium]|nr:metallophosphoesterase [Acidobacteriota bacterium]
MAGRTIVVGDIHGCFDELQDLLATVAFAGDDRLICVGDLIVKGPKNREVLDMFGADERCASVLGNHDRALLRFWRGEKASLKEAQQMCRAELEAGGRRPRYEAFLASLPLMIDLGASVVVHAGVRPGVALAAQVIEDLTELRTLGADRTAREGAPWYEQYDGEKLVLFGHWPAEDVRRGRRAIGLDTGCVYGGRLTAYIVETGEMKSVQARRVYDAP